MMVMVMIIWWRWWTIARIWRWRTVAKILRWWTIVRNWWWWTIARSWWIVLMIMTAMMMMRVM
jgi:hypothetical protein